jgi:putative flippase GtrA
LKFIDSTAVRFLLVGVGNTLAGLMIIYVAKVGGIGDVVANAVGYGSGFLLSFCLNRQWTFRHTDPIFRAFARFLGITALAYLANLALVMLAIHEFGINSFISQALGVPVYTAVSYLGSRWYVFSSKNKN